MAASGDFTRLAEELAKVRDKYCGGSQRKLARQLGVAQSTTYNLLLPLQGREAAQPTIETLNKIHAYLTTLDDYRGLRIETVLAWAGYAEPRAGDDQRLAELNEILHDLPKQDKEEILEFARMKARLRAERQ